MTDFEPYAVPILIADDEGQLRRLMARLLERAGHAVVVASDCSEALGVLRTQLVAAVVLDATLAPHGASEVIDALKGLEPRPGLILTGGDEPERGIAARLPDLGACFLRKPFSPDEFTREVAARLTR